MIEDRHFGLAVVPFEEIKTLLFYSGVRNLHPWAKSPVTSFKLELAAEGKRTVLWGQMICEAAKNNTDQAQFHYDLKNANTRV